MRAVPTAATNFRRRLDSCTKVKPAPQGFWPIQNRGELAALYSFLFLYVAARGGGSWSLDAKLRGGRKG